MADNESGFVSLGRNVPIVNEPVRIASGEDLHFVFVNRVGLRAVDVILMLCFFCPNRYVFFQLLTIKED